MAVKGEQRSKFAAEVSYDGSGEIGNMERDRKLSGGELLDYVLLRMYISVCLGLN